LKKKETLLNLNTSNMYNPPSKRSACQCAVSQRPVVNKCCCISTRDVPIEHPDLAIYSQQEQLSLGVIPSWDSPDIVTNDWGPFRLRKEALVTVRNISSTPAANALVHYYTSPFGIGMRRTLKQSRQLSIGGGQQVDLNFPLDQETLNGDQRVGVHILIEHPRDNHSINNFGSQVHNGAYTTESGRNFTVQIPVFNDAAVSRVIYFSILPTNMQASLNLVSHNFFSFEQTTINLHIVVPTTIVGSAGHEINSSVTVVGRLSDGTLIGGVTHLLRINS
jgi:hypothetical protein